MPFKRYHIATVWRGENTQRGRYREFMQCDFDTIGTTIVAADIETAPGDPRPAAGDRLRGVHDPRQQPHGAQRAARTTRLWRTSRRPSCARSTSCARSGPRKSPRRCSSRRRRHARHRRREVLQLARTQPAAATRSSDSSTRCWPAARRAGRRGAICGEVVAGIAAAGVPERACRLDVSIARGSTITPARSSRRILDDLPSIGSVCSGGRYDNLRELYTKQELPGIGASLGLDRLLAAMEELGMIDKVATPAHGASSPTSTKDALAGLPAAGRRRAGGRASASRCTPSPRSSASS